MADLLALSARIIDSGTAGEPVNRVTQELSTLTDRIAMVESFSHSIAVATEDGLAVFDASGWRTGPRVVRALRDWSTAPVRTLVYTHGHLDHVGGSPAFLADAEQRGHPRPSVVAHQDVMARFRRYRRTDGWNRAINARQFGWVRNADLGIGAGERPGRASAEPFLPADVAEPDVTYADEHVLTVGEVEVHLHHGRGETDDHTWAGGMQNHFQFFARTFNFNPRHCRIWRVPIQFINNETANFLIFHQQFAKEFLWSKPPAGPAFGYTSSKPDWIDLLTHDYLFTAGLCFSHSPESAFSPGPTKNQVH